MKVAISSGQAQVSKEAPSSYAEQAKQAKDGAATSSGTRSGR